MKVTYIKTGKKTRNNKAQNVYDDLKIKSKENKREFNFLNNLEIKKSINNKPDKKSKNNNKGKINAMQTIFKKNQLVILSLALMLITAGYMNYTNNENELNISLAELGDAKLVGTNVYVEQNIENEVNGNEQSNDNENVIDGTETNDNSIQTVNQNNETNKVSDEEVNEINNDTVQTNNNLENNTINNQIETSNNIDSKDYFVQTRLDRDTMYSQMLETYQKILENERIPADQKGIASNEIKNINDRKSAIAIAENIIKTKDFEDVAILINDNSINVVVKQKENLTNEQVAKISNIVSRELKAEIGDIHITVHK